MAYSSHITIKNQFVGIHKWGNCLHEDVSFLTNKHRHVFYVQTDLPVNHDDRDLEFFTVQTVIDNIIDDLYTYDKNHRILGNLSCEMVSKDIVGELQKVYSFLNWIRVTVSEDGENSATVKWEKD